MRDNRGEAWVQMLEGGMVGQDIPGVGLVYTVTVKIEFAGVLAILKVKGGGGYQVCFVGAKDLKRMVEKIRPILAGEGGRWREDQYK